MLTRFRLLPAMLLVLLAPAHAHAAGAWSTYIRAFGYNQLLAGADTVWCATEEAGLLRYVRSSGAFLQTTREPGGLASNQISSIAFDRRGRLWLGTRDAGVSRLDPDGTWGLLNAFDGLPGLDVNTLTAQGDTLWIGTTTGLALWNGREISGALPDGTGYSPFANNDIVGIVVRGDSLWVATRGGVYYSNIAGGLAAWTEADTNLPLDKVTALATDGVDVFAVANNAPWRVGASGTWNVVGGISNVYLISGAFGTVHASSDLGLYAWNGTGWSPVNTALTSNGGASTFAVTRDASGKVFAANRDGMFEQTPSGPWTLHLPEAPPGNNMQSVAVQGARVYAGTFAEGVGRLETAGGTWTNWYPVPCASNCDQTFLDPSFAFGLLVDRQGKKWIGIWGTALEKFDDSGAPPQFTHLWVGAGSPIDNHTWVWSTAADSVGNRWFGMDTPNLGCNCPQDPIGIDVYGPADTLIANYQTTNTPDMLGNQVRALSVDRRGDLWVGYGLKGVQRFTPSPPGPLTSHLNLEPSGANWNVFGVVAHNDSIWVFSDGDLRLYTNFGSAGGSKQSYAIPAAPASRGALHPLAVAADGTAWVGSVNGARAYHPGGLTEDFTASNSPLANDEIRSIAIDHATGAIWFATAGGLNRYDPGYQAPAPPTLAKLAIKVYPNPALLASGIGISLRVSGNGSAYRGQVYDLNGRMLRRLSAGSNGQILWDGRDSDGSLVRPGLYFVRVEAGGRSAVARVTLLR